VSGSLDQVSDDEVPIPCLHVASPPRPSAHVAAATPSDSDDEFSFRVPPTVRLWFRVLVMLRFLSCDQAFLALSPPLLLLLFALNLPCSLAATANALSGMVHTDCFFFFFSLTSWSDMHGTPALIITDSD
jgi:hypothetical protein